MRCRFFLPALLFSACAAGGLCFTAAARGQAVTAPNARPLNLEQNNKAADYDDELNRLAEILGSLHYLSNLCAPVPAANSAAPAGGSMPAAAGSMQWRNTMAQLLTALHGDAQQTARLAAAFNRAYQAFADNYGSCAPSAREALARYQAAGQDLSNKLLEDFGGNFRSDE